MLRPDQQFDDPSAEEWAAYVFEYMEQNIERAERGFTTAMLQSDLNIGPDVLYKATCELFRRGKIHEVRNFGNATYMAPIWHGIPKPELTELQHMALEALKTLSVDGIVEAPDRVINDAMTEPRKTPAGISGLLGSLDWKGKINILQRGNGCVSRYQILDSATDTGAG